MRRISTCLFGLESKPAGFKFRLRSARKCEQRLWYFERARNANASNRAHLSSVDVSIALVIESVPYYWTSKERLFNSIVRSLKVTKKHRPAKAKVWRIRIDTRGLQLGKGLKKRCLKLVCDSE